MRPIVFVALAGSVLCLAAAGCSGEPQTVIARPLDPSQERLQKIGQSYREFNRKQHRPPKSAADLEPLLKERAASDDIMISAHDGQPFEIAWDLDVVKPRAPGRGRPVLAYEVQGKQGMRWVLTTVGSVEYLTDSEFRDSAFPPGHEPKN